MFAVIHSTAVGYCGASARIKFDDEQFAALFNELQTRGDKTKLMQFVWSLSAVARLFPHIVGRFVIKQPK